MPGQQSQLELDGGGDARDVRLGAHAILFRGFAKPHAAALLNEIEKIEQASPLRHMVVPGGKPMSVGMTNAGKVGWVSDRRGYRYEAIDPATGKPWPQLPTSFSELASNAAVAAGFGKFLPDVCLINQYRVGTRLSLHQDRDERDFSAPIVSVSLGLPAIFLWGTQSRADRPGRHVLHHGDVVVWGGADRLTFHGILPLKAGNHPLTGECRYNLTFRKAL